MRNLGKPETLVERYGVERGFQTHGLLADCGATDGVFEQKRSDTTMGVGWIDEYRHNLARSIFAEANDMLAHLGDEDSAS